MWTKWLALLVVSWALSGCYVLFIAPPFLFQNTFDDKRAQIKRDLGQGLYSKEAAQLSCLSMLRQVDAKHTAPPPYPDEVCDFGSFTDRRYELTKLLNQGVISKDTWERECLALPDRPEMGNPCLADQLQEKLAAWRSQIECGYTTKEAVTMDCLQEAPAEQGEKKAQEMCQL